MIQLTPEFETYLEALIAHHINISQKQVISLIERNINRIEKRLDDIELSAVQTQRRIERIVDSSLHSSSSKLDKKH